MILEISGVVVLATLVSKPIYTCFNNLYKKKPTSKSKSPTSILEELQAREFQKINEDYTRLYDPLAFWLHPELHEHCDSDLRQPGAVSMWEAKLPPINVEVPKDTHSDVDEHVNKIYFKTSSRDMNSTKATYKIKNKIGSVVAIADY